MKTLLVSILLLASCKAFAADAFYTATLLFTNNPANNDSVTINAKVWTFKSTVTDTATQVQIGATSGDTAGNYYSRIQSAPYPNVTSAIESTNKIRLNGKANLVITGSKVGTWGTVTITSTTLNNYTVTYDFSNRVDRVEMANAIIAGLTAYATNPAAATAPWLTNFVNRTGDQVIDGAKTLRGATTLSNDLNLIVGGIVSNALFKAIQSATITNLNVLGLAAMTNATPALLVTDSDAAADNKVIKLAFDNGVATLSIWNDALSSFANILTFARSGTTVGTISFPNGTVAPVKIVCPDIEGTITNALGGFMTIWTTNFYGRKIALTNTTPTFDSYDSDASSDNKRISVDFSDGKLTVFLYSDDLGSFSIPLQVQRSGVNASIVYIGGPSSIHTEVEGPLWNNGNTIITGNAGISAFIGIGTTNPTAPSGLSSGAIFTNVNTEASADPSSAAAVWSFNGELKARGVGDGVNWRLKNAATISIGSGSDYNLTGSYAQVTFGSSVTLSLPTAGTYRLSGIVTIDEDAGNANDSISLKLYNATDASDITGSEQTKSSIPAGKRDKIALESIVTVTGAKTIHLYGKNSTAARGSIYSQQTFLTYVRLF